MLKNLTTLDDVQSKSLFQILFSKFTEKRIYIALLIYSFLYFCYSILLSFVSSEYSIFPMSKGFCTIGYHIISSYNSLFI